MGKKLSLTSDQAKRKILLLFSVTTNLSILGFFKYYNFFVESTHQLLETLGFPQGDPYFLNVVLPVGISFYTFQSLSYTIDLYYNKTKAHKNLLSFAAYVALFPQLIAGPIVRHNELVPQLDDVPKSRFSIDNFAVGISFFCIGLAKKVLLADRIAYAIDPAIMNVEHLSLIEGWLCALGYTLQIYFDFSGYSDMAVGLGWMFNLRLPQNFNSPYKSESITEFWQRWHMSLSSWLRDYLYIPLGGNRKGTFLTYRNLMITMLLGGLWHGANWVFVIWGGYHGFLLAAHRYLKKQHLPQVPRQLKIATTFVLVLIGWIFFRSENLSQALIWFRSLINTENIFGLKNITYATQDPFFAALVMGLPMVFLAKNTFEMDHRFFTHKKALAYGLFLVVCTLFFVKKSPFLYFQF